MTACIRVAGLSKSFHGYKALDQVNLSLAPGEMVALIGASGSGKSTLLRHIAGLMCADADAPAVIEVYGRTVQCGGGLARDIRDIRSQIGFIFQQFNLVGRLPVITNVLAGMLYRVPTWRSTFRQFTHEEIREGMQALARVGMEKRALQRASTLSGGQQQRAAIARTLVQHAKVILADEPIASLDPESSRRVMEILATINREDRTTVMVSLHQVDIALRYCPRTVALHHGRVVYDGASENLTPALLRDLYGAEAEELFAPAAANASAAHLPPAAPPHAVPARPARYAHGAM